MGKLFSVLTMVVLATIITTGSANAAIDLYTVKSGDTLWKIATQHNLTIEELKKLNNLTSDTVKVAQKLTVSKKKVISEPTVVPKKPVPATDSYVVKSGDTLWKIATQHNLTVEELKKLNNLTSNTVKVAQKLTVSKRKVISEPTVVPKKPVPATDSYIVKRGDTLGKVAMQHKTTIDDLLSLNYLASDTLKVNQKLTVPRKIVQPKPTPIPKKIATDFYTVKSGDTLWKVATQHNLTIDELISMNKLKSKIIYSNQKLIVSEKVLNPKPSVIPKKTSLSNMSGDTKQPTIKKSISSKGTQFAAVEASLPFLDTPSVMGDSTGKYFNSSGFIYYVFNNAGLYIPNWDTLGMYTNSSYVVKPLPGDLVFFDGTYQYDISHVGIYLGSDNFIHAGKKKVEITSLSSVHWKDKFTGFKRFNQFN